MHSAGNETGCRFRFQKQNLRYGNGTATVGRYGAVPGRSVGRSFKWEAAAWHSAQEYMSTRTDADDFDVSQRRSASSPLRFVQNPTSDHRSRSVATSMTTSGPDCCCCCYWRGIFASPIFLSLIERPNGWLRPTNRIGELRWAKGTATKAALRVPVCVCVCVSVSACVCVSLCPHVCHRHLDRWTANRRRRRHQRHAVIGRR